MIYKQFTERCFDDGLLDRGEFEQILSEARDAAKQVHAEEAAGELPILSLSKDDSDLAEINEFAKHIDSNFKKLVVLGTGGSSLCGEALVNYAWRKESNTKIVFIPNIDPETWDEFLENLNIEETAFLVISKSGGTIETLVSFLACLDLTDKISEHFFIISEPNENPLTRLAKKYNIKTYEHDPNVGGRFAIFSLVGLMPGAVAGMNPKDFKAGGADFFENDIELAAYSAALHVAFMRKNIWQNVLMTYPDQLEAMNRWYRQIWAESLGKNRTGSTPIKSIGTFDQHSQMQLYLDGRKDKFFNFITLDMKGEGKKLPDIGVEGTRYLAGKTLGDVIYAEQQSAVQTIAGAGNPVRVIEIKELNSITLGKLTMHLMLETIITAKLLGVNPYDQPAVEAGKQLTRDILSK